MNDLAAGTPTPAEALRAQLAMIAGRRPSGLVEVRWRLRDGRGMGQLWHAAPRSGDLVETVTRPALRRTPTWALHHGLSGTAAKTPSGRRGASGSTVTTWELPNGTGGASWSA